jgi:small subunit ribosomal protein S16
MVRIRLRRVGAKANPKYRVVVTEKRAARDGAFIEVVGYYDPIPKVELLQLDKEKIQAWMKKGAQPSDGALKLLYKAGILPKPQYAEKPKAEKKDKKGKKGGAPKSAAPAAPAVPAPAPAKAEAEAAKEK